MFRLLDEYRPHVGCESKMIELKNAIETLFLESFTDPASAYRRFPSVMGLLIQPDHITAKEFLLVKSKSCTKLTEAEFGFLNTLERYDF